MAAVTVSAVDSTEIVGVDYQRTVLVISNSHVTSYLHIAFGEDATDEHAYIPPQGNMTLAGDRIPKCAVNGLSSAGNLEAFYSKLSAGS